VTGLESSSPLLLFLSGKTLAQLRALARTTDLSGTYSRLSRYELIEALLQALPALPGTEPGSTLPQPTASPAASAPLPAGAASAEIGGTSQVVFLPRDPHWAYVFWEVSGRDQGRAAAQGAQQLCLRVADVTGLPEGASHPHTLQEVVVDAAARSSFIPVPMSDRDYRVELGYRLAGGGWLSLVTSSPARVPADAPSTVVADRFVPFSLEGMSGEPGEVLLSAGVSHEQLYRRSSASSAVLRRVGSELLHEQASGADQQSRLHASGAGIWASGLRESGAGLQRTRSFWLVADAELIVYGATEPSASLFLGDRQVPLQADGSFHLQAPFRDGLQVYPIRAVAADGEQQRWIEIDAARSTPQARVNSREEAQLEWF
jgi:hypothetical protein